MGVPLVFSDNVPEVPLFGDVPSENPTNPEPPPPPALFPVFP
jgi:hypothetical protein